MSYVIMTDTSSNLPLSLLDKYGISQMPFTYSEDGKNYISCLDIENFDGHGYYERIKTGIKVNTSQINPQVYIDHMEPYLKDGNDILYIGMSSGISGSYNSSEVAANMLREDYPDRKIYTLDTKAASLGEGIIAIEAAKMMQDGVDIAQCFDKCKILSKKMYQIFTVDDLMHLKRTGRLSNASAIIGSVLGIKPLLKGNEKGQIVSIAKTRGFKKALEAMADKYKNIVKDASQQTIGIAHSDNPDGAQYLIDLLNKIAAPKEIINVMYEPVTGSHVGPGTVALFFMGDEDSRSL